MNEDNNQKRNDEVYSKVVRAGKRTYFFDVKATKNNDLYLTITESKKKFNKNGKFRFEKHKLFLYKEDFDKFSDGLAAAIDFIKENNETFGQENEAPEAQENQQEEDNQEADTEPGSESKKDFTDLDFDDLDKE